MISISDRVQAFSTFALDEGAAFHFGLKERRRSERPPQLDPFLKTAR